MERMTIDVVGDEASLPPRRAKPVHVLAVVGLALGALALWARGLPAFVAWEVAADHQRCFGRRQLPARIWSSDPAEVRDWMESRGTPTPLLPSEAGTAEIVGARYCALEDRVAAHVYYAGEGGMVSVYVLSGPVRIADGWSGTSRGLNVRLLRAVGRYVAVVGGSAADVAAAARAFASTVATARPARQPETLRPDGSPGTRPCARRQRPRVDRSQPNC